MNTEFYQHIQAANVAFTKKLNSVSFLSLIPFLLLYILYMITDSQGAFIVMIAFVVTALIYTFSKIPLSVRFRNIFMKDRENAELTLTDLEYLIAQFKRNTFFNRVLKTQHEMILFHLGKAYDILKVNQYKTL